MIWIQGICQRVDWGQMEMLRLCAVDGAFPLARSLQYGYIPFELNIVCRQRHVF